MGRRPNALLLEFFERGPKLEDQSNRYQHTCKRCGTIFPKGRPDALMRHLFEKCPKVTLEDRDRAFVRRQDGDLAGTYPSDVDGQAQMDTSTHLESQQALQREPSALDTLAEVSRQHLDLSRQRVQASGSFSAHSGGIEEPGHEQDDFFLQLRQTLDNHNEAERRIHDVEEGPNVLSLPAAPQPQEDMPLVQAASAANDLHAALSQQAPRGLETEETLPAQQGPSAYPQPREDDHLDPQLQAPEAGDRSLQTHKESDVPQAPQSAFHQQQQVLPVTSLQSGDVRWTYPAPTTRGFGLLQKPMKKQVRGRFTDERRKEVQGVRKMGACLRCRMLKKPCSGETPCSTCRTIESARLWKNNCIRTRVADEFNLYSTSLFHAKAHRKVHSMIGGMTLQKIDGRIEATLLPETQIYVTFNPMVVKDANTSRTDIDPLLEGQSESREKRPDVYMLDYESDDVTGKLERYLVDNTDMLIEQEASTFIKASLSTATELIRQQGDVLLAKAINLWTATIVLAYSGESRWNISYAADRLPNNEPELVNQTSASPGRSPHAFEPATPDYDVMKSQLLDAVERHCAKQSKVVMNELERRLLQRQQSSAFTTLLVSIILLNCVERMSYLYRELDTSNPSNTSENQPGADGSVGSDPASQSRDPAMPADWPLDAPPFSYWVQGESFSSLLHLLLRMRGLPPRTAVRPNGTLAVITAHKHQPTEVPIDGSPGADADSQVLMAAQWVARTGSTIQGLVDAKEVGDQITPEGRGWDLRFIAGLLAPT